MRLIDADVLKEKAWDADTRCGYVQVVDVGDIDNAPTIEPEQPEWVKAVQEKYHKALEMPFIEKPLAWALYQAWKEYDRKESK